MPMKLAKLLSVVVFLILVVMMPTVQATVCKSNPCKNGATCGSSGASYYCDCAFGYIGSACQVPFCTLTDSDGQCISHPHGNTQFPNVPSQDPVGYSPDPVAAPTSVTSPSTIAISVIALIGLIGLRWSRRKR
jgi:hypothetical protein